MGELMSLGIPLICNDNVGDVEAILRDGGNGVLMSQFDDAACAKAVSELDAVLQADPQLNMKCALKHYSLQDGVKRYSGVYEKLWFIRDDRDDYLKWSLPDTSVP